MTFAQLLSAELYIEPAAIAILQAADFEVISPFVAVDAEGRPNLAPAKDDQVFVLFDFGSDSGEQLVFQEGTVRDQSVKAGWRGALRVTHRVAVGDGPVADGVTPDNPFAALLPQYDFLSIDLAQPDRTVDRDRSVNQATEIFDLRFTATEDLEAAE